MRRVRILRIVTRLNTGGPARRLTTLTRGLDSDRYEQWLAAGREGVGEGSMRSLVEAQGVRLIWLHAAAASMDGAAILLAGPAGAGKSTLLGRLVDRTWQLLADDVVALRPNRAEALPLPFNPEVRATPFGIRTTPTPGMGHRRGAPIPADAGSCRSVGWRRCSCCSSCAPRRDTKGSPRRTLP